MVGVVTHRQIVIIVAIIVAIMVVVIITNLERPNVPSIEARMLLMCT